MGTTAFEVIVKQQIKRLEDPSLKCINMIYDELVRILAQLLQKPVFRRFPNLRERFNTVIVNYYKKQLPVVQKLVSDVIAAESTYVNTAHPDFISGHQAMSIASEKLFPKPPPEKDGRSARASTQVSPLSNQMSKTNLNDDKDDSGFFSSFWPTKKPAKKSGVMESVPAVLKASGNLSEREMLEMETIKILITSYYNIVKRTVSDVVPKAIMYQLVVRSKEDMQRELLTEVYSKKEEVSDAMKESEFVVQRRIDCKKMIEALQKADEIISQVVQ